MQIKMNGLELINFMWFTSRTCVGIVLCIDETTKEETAFIGAAVGEDETFDVSNIMMWGAKFPVDVAKQLMQM